MSDLTSAEHRSAAQTVRELISVYHEHEDLISIGAYRTGSNPKVDAAIAMKPEIDGFLRQGTEDSTDLDATIKAFVALAQRCRQSESAANTTGAS